MEVEAQEDICEMEPAHERGIDILNEEIPRDIAMAEEANIEIIDEKAPDGTLPDDHPDTNNGETLKEEMEEPFKGTPIELMDEEDTADLLEAE